MLETLEQALDARTAEAAAALVRDEGAGSVRCLACGHRCLIRPGRRGICRVRFNQEGSLRVPRGYVAALQCDPIEKKPFFHALPGADALSFGMLGCDLKCGYCQNWVTSQALRDPASTLEREDVTAAQLVDLALRRGAPVVASTYNEPLITAEWAHEVFEAARRRGLLCAFVSNGNATPEVLDYIRPLVDLYKVDLKAYDEKAYRSLGGTLANVLKTIERLLDRKFWVEVVTLTIPGFNDSEGQLRGIAKFLAALSRDIPWHVTAFHKDYRMTDPRDTTARDLVRAAGIGEAEGLRFVYAGNLPGRVGKFEDTRCPACGATVVRRVGYRILDVALRGNDCRACGARIPGVWTLPDGRSTWTEPTGWRLPEPVVP